MWFFFSIKRRHTRCALVTGVQTCALPIWMRYPKLSRRACEMARTVSEWIAKNDDAKVPARVRDRIFKRDNGTCHICKLTIKPGDPCEADHIKIRRASCRERVCQYVLISVVAVTLNNKIKTIIIILK